MKRIAVLGSTGSVGVNTLDVIRRLPEDFQAVALATRANTELLLRQIEEFRPEFVCVTQEDKVLELKGRLKAKVRLYAGQDGLEALIKEAKVEEVVLAISGAGALGPLLVAIDSGKDVVLANKEALVMAGALIKDRLAKKKTRLKPVDSEQSAVWQCLEGQDKAKLKRIYLTASGGPFRNKSGLALRRISAREALSHPRWNMGRKISVDSATLMNKGLEVIEAMFLFDLPPEKIRVVIHPEAIIHSMVEFLDGVVLAELSVTDMRIPIQYALSYPRRLTTRLKGLDFYKLKMLNFQRPDLKKFPCLRLAYQAANQQGSSPCVLNAANEVCVQEFLRGELGFMDIPRIIEQVMRQESYIARPNLGDILRQDAWARDEALRLINND